MNIIRVEANENGARPPIQSWDRPELPNGYIAVPDGVDASAMQTHGGFVDLTMDEGGALTAITGNDEKYQVYLDNLPPEPEEPEDTAGLSPGCYCYDVRLVGPGGETVDTIVPRSEFRVEEAVGDV